jgi:hypothetical protein
MISMSGFECRMENPRCRPIELCPGKRSGNDHGVDVFPFEQAAKICVDVRRRCERDSCFLGPALIHIADSHDAARRVGLEQLHVRAAATAATDQSDTDAIVRAERGCGQSA